MFTPTATSAMVSGAVLRVMVWLAAEHVDEVPYVRDVVSTEKIKAWINDHKQLALIITSDRVSCRRRQAEEIRGKEQAAGISEGAGSKQSIPSSENPASCSDIRWDCDMVGRE